VPRHRDVLGETAADQETEDITDVAAGVDQEIVTAEEKGWRRTSSREACQRG